MGIPESVVRFTADGPSIPDDLLIARDEGRVIFFCGAGVSRARAELPDFFGLSKIVLHTLRVSADSPARKLMAAAEQLNPIAGVGGLVTADRIFGLLEREFLSRDIAQAVAQALTPTNQPDLSAHKIMIDLSRGPDSKVRLVTTNFDLLFEEASNNSLPSHQPPTLPRPSRAQDFVGVIHLHGKVNDDYSNASGDGFILSTAEFGKAYLAEGWATQFIREILESYYVVFVGYGADDPPVHYLLEALNRSASSRPGLYAFQSGRSSDVEAIWRHKGVEPIAYGGANEHRALWATLEAWAERARNYEGWYDTTIAKASSDPKTLAPHERGQIIHIVSSLYGARRFAEATPSPSAEWLCVFDPVVRYSKPARKNIMDQESAYVDPFEWYGLDSDPIPPQIEPNDHFTKREVPAGVLNPLSSTEYDRKDIREFGLATLRGRHAANASSLPPRVWHLATWIGRVADQGITVWWAAEQSGFHPSVRDLIRHNLRNKPITETANITEAWRYLFEAWDSWKDYHHDYYELKFSVDREGWSNSLLRQFAAILRPFFEVRRSFWKGYIAPAPEIAINIRDLIHRDVQYPSVGNDLSIPDDRVADVLPRLRNNLQHAIELETELGSYGLTNLCPIEPDPSLTGQTTSRGMGINFTVLFFVSILRRLITTDPQKARNEYLAWPQDNTIFARLRIWMCGTDNVLSNQEIGATLARLPAEVFWGERHQRDLLLVLARKWTTFPPSARKRIERKLLRGPARWPGENKERFSVRRPRAILARLSWLDENGCNFGFDVGTTIAKLRETVPDWRPEQTRDAAASIESRSGWVGTNTSHSELLAIPLSEVIATAMRLSGHEHFKLVENDPFAGLAKEHRVRAFAALRLASKHDEIPTWAWKKFLYSDARKAEKQRMVLLVADLISKLPNTALREFIHPAVDWMEACQETLIGKLPSSFDQLWDKFISVLTGSADANQSAMITRKRGRDWVGEAINSPAGKLAQILTTSINNLSSGSGLPVLWKSRAAQLLNLPGDSRDYALALLATNLSWFYSVDKNWTDDNFLCRLDLETPGSDGLLAGFLWQPRIAGRPLYDRLKPILMREIGDDHKDSSRHGVEPATLLLGGWLTRGEDDSRWISNDEMRAVLRRITDSVRKQILWQVEHWEQLADKLHFLTEVWPKEKSLRTPEISSGLCRIAFANETEFPVLADAVLPLLSSVAGGHLILPNVLKPKENSVVTKYPEQSLSLLWAILPEDPSAWPHGAGNALELIASTKPELVSDRRFIELKKRLSHD